MDQKFIGDSIVNLTFSHPSNLALAAGLLLGGRSPARKDAYLAFTQQPCLLQSGPDALDSPSMLWMNVSVSTGTLVL